MTATIQTILLLLAVLVVVAIVARRLNIAPSILLVIAGIALALIPGLPRIELDAGTGAARHPAAADLFGRRRHELARIPLQPAPDHAVGIRLRASSPPARWRRRRTGCSACRLAIGFVLGAIVAPPDAVAPLAIVRRLGVPRRLVVVLEGEGLANDATALILYRFAVAAVATGVVFVRRGRRHLRSHRRGRNRLRHRRRLAQPASAPLGAGPARRNHAVTADALRRVSGAAAIWADRACWRRWRPACM